MIIIAEVLGLAVFAYERPNYGQQAEVSKLWIKLLKEVGTIGCITLLAFAVSRPYWTDLALRDRLQIAAFVFLCIAVILFIVAVILEIKNPANNYSVKRRFLKYAAQECSFIFFALCIFAFSMTHDIPGQTTQADGLMNYTFYIISLAGLLTAAKKTGTTIFYIWAFAHPPELKQNSKEMKELRKSILK